MKQFKKGLMEWKASACAMYTAAMCFYLVFSLILDNRQVSLTFLWEMLLVCVVGSLIQSMCFSNWIIKKLRYTWRSLLFVALFLPLLAAAAWKMEWFPLDRAASWALFVGVFFMIFLGTTVGFEIYFQISGRKYDGLIGQYRKAKEEDRR